MFLISVPVYTGFFNVFSIVLVRRKRPLGEGISASFKTDAILPSENPQLWIASKSFFDHMEDVDDEYLIVDGNSENFDTLLRENCNHRTEDEIMIATLKRFISCEG